MTRLWTISAKDWIVRILLIFAVSWAGFTAWIWNRGSAFCAAPLRIIANDALIRRGVWEHILSDAAGDLALANPGVPQPQITEQPLDDRRVNEFLLSHPNCCRVFYPGNESIPFLIYNRIAHPSKVLVHVNVPPPPGIIRNRTYSVDACSSNITGAS
jgi:hypothetical protein